MSAGSVRWGFHQLADHYARELVRRADVPPGDLVVDIGAGTGRISRHLLANGARVIAVEMHAGRAATLRTTFKGAPLRVLDSDLAAWRPPSRPYRVVANPPFDRLAMLLRLLTARDSRLVRADLVVPDYVAARWSRGRGYNAQLYRADALLWLPPGAFVPPARSPARVIRLVRRRRAQRR